MIAEEGSVFAVWHRGLAESGESGERLCRWLAEWQSENGARPKPGL
jgi:hypothetical protein